MKTSQKPRPHHKPRFADLFMPKIVTVWREGYGLKQLRADTLAGLTVAVVALPLSIAIAVASGATPAQGLVTAIIGGLLVSLLGGSRFQIGGPAGAFIVLVNATAVTHGMDGLILAVLLSGIMLAVAGWLRLGTFVKFVPYPVTVGFTAGIGVIILASQFKDLFGLTLQGAEPGPFVEKVKALVEVAPTANISAISVAALSIILIVAIKAYRPQWPGILMAVIAASITAVLFNLDVATIASRFGEMPHSLSVPQIPNITLSKVYAVLPVAFSFALLGSIESLLSAVVADGMTGRRHRSNCELVAQGFANIGSAMFGGICVTGTIARTATNVRAGAHGPLAGILHSVFLLLMMALAAPLIGFIPMAALAGVLAVVAWNMFERHAFYRLIRASRGDAIVLLATFGLTIFRDLTEAILVGFAIGALLFIYRMSQSVSVELGTPLFQPDMADTRGGSREPYHEEGSNSEIVVCRISGAFFFGAAATIGTVLDSIGDKHRAIIVDFSAVPLIDSTGVQTVKALLDSARRKNVEVYLTGLSDAMAHEMLVHGVISTGTHREDTVKSAMDKLTN